MFGTLQKRLPQELRLAGITEMAEANRFLREVYLPLHNARFATPAEDKGSAFVPFAGALDDILCVQQERTVGNDNTVRYHARSEPADPTRPPSPPLRQGKGQGARVSRRNPRPLPRPQMLGPLQRRRRAHRQPNPAGRVIRFDAARRCPVDKWTAAPRPTTSPQAQPHQQKRSTHLVHKPVNSKCSRHCVMICVRARRRAAPSLFRW